jgi:outer membrane receptor protein involved in Fe transport
VCALTRTVLGQVLDADSQLLQFVASSFSSNRQTGSDHVVHVDPASLRGRGPDLGARDYKGDNNRYHPRLTTDLALSYALTHQLRLSLGSSNLFNQYPNFFNPQATETGGAWDPVQMGSNGRFLFAKLQARF